MYYSSQVYAWGLKWTARSKFICQARLVAEQVRYDTSRTSIEQLLETRPVFSVFFFVYELHRQIINVRIFIVRACPKQNGLQIADYLLHCWLD